MSSTAAPRPTTTAEPEDLALEAGDFVNINDMTPVRAFFVSNPLGHLDEAIKVANDPNGGQSPVGTILQLIPTEAMVKRTPGFSPKTNDWEFFALETDATGTRIADRGGTEVINQFGLQCFSCHEPAEKFDLICGQDHGCEPLPIGRDVIEAVQQSDPRPRQPTGN